MKKSDFIKLRNELHSKFGILQDLDPQMEVKMYLFSPVNILPDNREEVFSPLRVDCYNINDVLISNYGNSVLLASMLNLYHNV